MAADPPGLLAPAVTTPLTANPEVNAKCNNGWGNGGADGGFKEPSEGHCRHL